MGGVVGEGCMRGECDDVVAVGVEVVGSERALPQEEDLAVELIEEAGLGREGQGSSADGLQHGYE